jgi:hypothetical protein
MWVVDGSKKKNEQENEGHTGQRPAQVLEQITPWAVRSSSEQTREGILVAQSLPGKAALTGKRERLGRFVVHLLQAGVREDEIQAALAVDTA